MDNFYFSKNDTLRLILQETLLKVGEVVVQAHGVVHGVVHGEY